MISTMFSSVRRISPEAHYRFVPVLSMMDLCPVRLPTRRKIRRKGQPDPRTVVLGGITAADRDFC
ncbi:protein of unknown function [Rhodovastum atsumiense]|nr:protein of unknown function [Rhodovastum atsumiense]